MSDERKATPGPWKVLHHDGPVVVFVREGADGQIEERTRTLTMLAVLEDERDAAPDLLAALESVERAYDDESGTDLDAHLEAIIGDIRSAIAKARGGAKETVPPWSPRHPEPAGTSDDCARCNDECNCSPGKSCPCHDAKAGAR